MDQERRIAATGSRMLPVGDGHSLYVESFGNPEGVPAVFLHGGPGSGCQPAHRSLFDPAVFYAVLFDQRGAGRSQPRRSRDANTTAHLVADIEQVREALGIERWLVVGGSWGATLALAYAEAHPQRVLGLALRSVFLGTKAELDWAFLTVPAQLYPDLREDFLSLLPEAERADPLPGYWCRILDPDPAVHGPFARAFADTERILSEIAPPSRRLDLAGIARDTARLPSTAFMEAHYFEAGCFMPDGALLAGARRLADIPGIIIQGRYDLLCPPATSAALAAAWPAAEVRIIPGAGHSVTDPGVMAALKAAIDEPGRALHSPAVAHAATRRVSLPPPPAVTGLHRDPVPAAAAARRRRRRRVSTGRWRWGNSPAPARRPV